MSQFYGGSSKKTFFDFADVQEKDFIKIEKSFNSWGAPIEVNFSGDCRRYYRMASGQQHRTYDSGR